MHDISYWHNYSGKKCSRYFTDWNNWLDIAAITTTILIIPLRFANLDVQWIFASLTYMFHGLRVFKYAIILRWVYKWCFNLTWYVDKCMYTLFSFFGVYVKVLVRVVLRDLNHFLLVFIVFMIIYGGGFYLALRGEPCPLVQVDNNGSGFDPISDTSLCLHPDETRYVCTAYIGFSW